MFNLNVTAPTTLPVILHSVSCEEKSEDIERMRQLLQDDPTLMTQRDNPQGDYRLSLNTFPIHHAILHNHNKCVEFLLQADPRNTNFYDEVCKFNPLLIALATQGEEGLRAHIKSKCEHIIELLLKYGASPSIPVQFRQKGWSHCKYLEYATQNSRNPKIIKMLLDHGCELEDFDIRDNKLYFLRGWEVPLKNTIKCKNIKVFKLLLLYGASLCFYYNGEIVPFSIPHMLLVRYRHQLVDGNLSDVLDALKAFKLHGGNLWSLHEKSESVYYNVLEFLQHQILFRSNVELEKKVEDLMKTPLSLQCLSRLAIKKVFGRKYVHKIELLPLPAEIIDFLRFTDLE